ncbi:MAG: hypothetical protein IPJ34_24115 [Myxococcales bacterium]|nr:hypothetical protein [Myxococcales bacterium]
MVAAFGVGTVVVSSRRWPSSASVRCILAWVRCSGRRDATPEAWWLVAFSLLVPITVAASVLLGEAMRDTLDPKERLRT